MASLVQELPLPHFVCKQLYTLGAMKGSYKILCRNQRKKAKNSTY